MNLLNKLTPINLVRSPHYIKINILGFRNLESTGLFPIRNVKLIISTSSIKKIDNIEEGDAFTQF